MKRILRIIGLTLLFISMGLASNWDLPRETEQDWEMRHLEEIRHYEEEREKMYCVVIDGEVYEGAYINGLWYEPLEIYGGNIPGELMED